MDNLTSNMYRHGISVIICTYNGEKLLPQTLENLMSQRDMDHINWEVILVDNASSDNTQMVAKSTWGSFATPLRIVYEKRPGREYAIKTGLGQTQYAYVINVDDDNRLADNYLSEAVRLMDSDENMGLLGGIGESDYEMPIASHLKPLEAALALGPQHSDSEGYLNNARTLYGAGMVIRRSFFDNLFEKGFRYYLTGRKGKKLSSGEDQELCLAFILAGYKLYYSEKLKFKHAIGKSRVTFEYLVKLHKAFGRTEFVFDQYKNRGNLFKGVGYKIATKNYLFYIFYIGYLAIKATSKYLVNRSNISRYMEMLRKRELFFYALMHPKLFMQIRYSLKNAEWVNSGN